MSKAIMKCKHYREYKAIYKPRCNNGHGCVTCWKKYFDKHGVLNSD